MEYIWTCPALEAVQLAVVQHLQARGLAIPRGDPDLQSVRGEVKCGFGSPLSSQPTSPCQWRDHTFQLPSIFVVLVDFLDGHVCDEGLFRKAGSVSRQRSLRRELECGEPSLPQDSNAHDVASLLKQFLRELPHPLVPTHFWPLLEACASLVPVREQGKCLLLACLLLPLLHLQCLCVVMGLLSRISKGAGHSLMDAHNLAIVMGPNLLQIPAQSFQLRDTTLATQTKIVEMLIEEVSELGKVPQEVGVAASSLKVRSGVTETKSLDDILYGGKDPLPDSRSSRLTSSISGFLSGMGNMIRRRKLSVTSGDGHMTLPLFRKSVKRSQPAHEEDRLAKRPALEVSEDRKPLPLSAETHTHEEPDGVQVHRSLDMGSSLAQPAPPTPLVFTHLRTVKVRYSRPATGDSVPLKEDQAPLKGDQGDSSSSSNAQETHPSNSHASLLRTPINRLCRNPLRTTAGGRDHVTRTPTEDVFRFPPVPTLTPNLLETISSEIDLRKRVLRHSHTHNDDGHTHNNGHTHSVDKNDVKAVDTSADSANRSGYDSRYSATLGIQLSDLPRRKLRGRGATRDPVPSQVTKDSNSAVSSQQGVRRAGPASPVVHSASLGITALGQEVGGAPPDGGGGVRQDVGMAIKPRRRLNTRQQESGALVATPPLPLVRILDSNKSRRHLLPNYLPPVLPSVTKPDRAPFTCNREASSLPVTLPSCTGGQKSVDLPESDLPSAPVDQKSADTSVPMGQKSTDPTSALQTLQECALPRTSQRFRSPWRWGSIGSRLKYTPVREKGSVSKRAKAYVVDMPRPFLTQPSPGLALKRGTSLKENVPVDGDGKSHPSTTPLGLKRSCSLMDATPSRDGNHTHFAVQEWVL